MHHRPAHREFGWTLLKADFLPPWLRKHWATETESHSANSSRSATGMGNPKAKAWANWTGSVRVTGTASSTVTDWVIR
jgi:hypothetical protein